MLRCIFQFISALNVSGFLLPHLQGQVYNFGVVQVNWVLCQRPSADNIPVHYIGHYTISWSGCSYSSHFPTKWVTNVILAPVNEGLSSFKIALAFYLGFVDKGLKVFHIPNVSSAKLNSVSRVIFCRRGTGWTALTFGQTSFSRIARRCHCHGFLNVADKVIGEQRILNGSQRNTGDVPPRVELAAPQIKVYIVTGTQACTAA
jgi:hypothetical protein